ncbi:MAG: hypothetical protein IJU08_04355 [Bacteroidales bacterium]|nr:hypothetical protein [Bacteroidales bacterium]
MKVKFTKLAALLLAGVALLAAGCTDYEVDIQNVDKKVNDLAVKTAADLNAQVDALKAMIATLETNYKAADDALKAEIQQKIDAINTQISDLQNLKLDKSTFETYKSETAETLRLLQEAVQSIKDNYATKAELETAVAGINEKLKDYVLTTTFQEFVDIAATDAELAALKTDLEGQIATAKSELEAAYKAADEALEKKIQGKIDGLDTRLKKVEADIESLGIQLGNLKTTVNGILDELKFAEGNLQGYIDDAAAKALADAKKYVDDEIAKIRTELLALRETVGTLQERIQSIVFVPDYDDLKITTNLLYLSQTVEGEDGETEEMVSVIDQPFKVTYEILPAQYAVAVAYFADEILQFDVKPVATRADDDAAAAPAIDFMKNADGEIIFEYDEATVEKTGLITFTVMPKNIASEAYAANGLKPKFTYGLYAGGSVGAYEADPDAPYGYTFAGVFGMDEREMWEEYGYDVLTFGVWNIKDLEAFEARAAFAASLRMKMLEGYNVDYPGYYFQEFNEVASTYNVLYPNKTADIEILPDPYKPDLDEDGKPKTDADGNVKLVKATPEKQYLPYSSLRENPIGEAEDQDPKGYRVILDQVVPGFEITVGDEVKILTAEDAARNGYIVPPVETVFDKFTYEQNGAETLDENNFVETAKVYAEIEMNPEVKAAVRKQAVGNLIDGHYYFTTAIGKTPFFGEVEITEPQGTVHVDAEIVWTYSLDANVDHNLWVKDYEGTQPVETVEGGEIYTRVALPINVNADDAAKLETELAVTIADFEGATPTTVKVTTKDEDGKDVEVTDLQITNVAIKDGKLFADIANFEWDKTYTIEALYDLPKVAHITVIGTLTTVDRNREIIKITIPEYAIKLNGEDYDPETDTYTSKPQDILDELFAKFVANKIINQYDPKDYEAAADFKGDGTPGIGGKEGHLTRYVGEGSENDSPYVILGDDYALFYQVSSADLKKVWEAGDAQVRNVLTFIGQQVEITWSVTVDLPAYDFLHLRYYTFNPEEVADGFITNRNFDDNPGTVKWWTQVYPSYFNDKPAEDGSTPEQSERVSNRYALADYDVAYINIAELAFNVVDEKDVPMTDEQIEAEHLVVKFDYTDEAQGALPLPTVDQLIEKGLEVYDDLWMDRDEISSTVFYYRTNEKKFIPVLGSLAIMSGETPFELPTRFDTPKPSQDPAVTYTKDLDYSTYALVRWTPFKDAEADGYTMVLDENKIYRVPLFKGMNLVDNRPNGLSYDVIKDGEWVEGDVTDPTITSKVGNGYLEGVMSYEAYHIEPHFTYDDLALPAELRKLLTIVYSKDNGETFMTEEEVIKEVYPNGVPEGEKAVIPAEYIPYVQYDYTSEVQFHGVVTIDVNVVLENPWQEALTFSYDFIIKGVGD